ncbi:unnamed protein product [Didymodactylos carnosus]|uniref:Uncharacterized protein n=1 Tax=Didymodactylos carnosus TaxID=1234261 RepID=A0A8S2ER25_9BILA|nr:unnamed protein product [Didymodactylos carnosus]CAF4091500.1 unnamed protein product [Didymodactylos carnosus]
MNEIELNQQEQEHLNTILAQLQYFLNVLPELPKLTIYHITMPMDHYERSTLADLYAELGPTPRRFCDLTGIPVEAFQDLYPTFVRFSIRKMEVLQKRRHTNRVNANVLLLLLIWI